jgi:hypothetical protein
LYLAYLGHLAYLAYQAYLAYLLSLLVYFDRESNRSNYDADTFGRRGKLPILWSERGDFQKYREVFSKADRAPGRHTRERG